jgi:hypothetical protein
MFFFGLVVGLEHKGRPCKMCDSVQQKLGHTTPGVSKKSHFFSQIKLFSFCAKVAPERHKLQKPSKLKKKCKKKTVFSDFFEYSSIWGQS